jgi:hypothetical protein
MGNYMFKFSFSYCILHLEGEEVFGSTKESINSLPSAKNDFHHFNRVNLFHPKVTVPIAQPNVVGNVSM